MCSSDLGVVPVNSTTGNATLQHVFVDDGSYVMTITVIDDDGDVVQGTETVVVTNIAPTVDQANGPSQALEGQQVAFSAAASDPGTLDSLTYSWDFGDGQGTANGTSVT